MDGGRGEMSTWFREQIESVKYIFKWERQGEEQNLSLMFTTEGTMYIYGKQKSPEPNLVVKSRGNNVKKKISNICSNAPSASIRKENKR